MAREHALMYVLSGIILLNIIALLLLQNRLEEKAVQEIAAPQEVQQNVDTPVIRPERPDVRVIILGDGVCDDCFNISAYVDALNDSIDMQVERIPALSSTSYHVFNSPRLPALAFNSTLEEYPDMIEGWERIGMISDVEGTYAGRWYVLPTQHPPFMENGTVHGRVHATYVTIQSCSKCYDSEVLREAMSDIGITPHKETFIDAQSAPGKALIKKYNITAVPTLIMDEQAKYYPLQPGWDVVGTVEKDGSYVLRNMQRMRVTYYDLQRQMLMEP